MSLGCMEYNLPPAREVLEQVVHVCSFQRHTSASQASIWGFPTEEKGSKQGLNLFAHAYMRNFCNRRAAADSDLEDFPSREKLRKYSRILGAQGTKLAWCSCCRMSFKHSAFAHYSQAGPQMRLGASKNSDLKLNTPYTMTEKDMTKHVPPFSSMGHQQHVTALKRHQHPGDRRIARPGTVLFPSEATTSHFWAMQQRCIPASCET